MSFKHYNEYDAYIEKINYLKEFLDKYASLPKQGSIQWLANRTSTIGGSEMSILEGNNPYKDLRGLVMSKLGWDTFKGNIATNWGKIFEPITQRVLELLFKCQLYEASSLPGCIEGTSYSPDGFAVALTETIISLIFNDYIVDHELPTSDAISILFEIKSPYKRIPDNHIPLIYLSQPKSGLCHFPFLDIAYFVDVAYRKCKIDAVDDNYDFSFHNDKERLEGHIVEGFIGVYNVKDVYHTETSVVDFGMSHYYDMLQMSNNIDNHVWDCYNSEPIFVKDSICDENEIFVNEINVNEIIYNNKEQFLCFCEKNDYSPIGYLKYKGFNLKIIPVYREPDFVINLAPEVKKVLRVIDLIKKAPNQQETFDSIFKNWIKKAPTM